MFVAKVSWQTLQDRQIHLQIQQKKGIQWQIKQGNGSKWREQKMRYSCALFV